MTAKALPLLLSRARQQAVIVALVLVACTLTAQESQTARNPRTSRSDVAAGAKTFRSHCSPCHGMRGEGGLGPNLASGSFYHGATDRDLLKNISDGIPGTAMPGLFYSPDRVWQVVAYIRSLNATAAAGVRGNAANGAALFKSQGCAGCHRIRGEGGRLGPDLSQIGQTRSPEFLRQSIVEPDAEVQPRYWVVHCRDASGADYEGFRMNEDTYTIQFIDMHERLRSFAKADLQDFRIDKKSKMPSYKDSLASDQIQDMVSYLASLRAPGGVK